LNGEAAAFIQKQSLLEKLKEGMLPLTMGNCCRDLRFGRFANDFVEDRAQYLYDSKQFEIYHQSVAAMGDTTAPSAEEGDRLGQHFVAFVKGADGHLYELEGSRVSSFNLLICCRVG